MQKEKLAWFVGYIGFMRIDKYGQKGHFSLFLAEKATLFTIMRWLDVHVRFSSQLSTNKWSSDNKQ